MHYPVASTWLTDLMFNTIRVVGLRSAITLITRCRKGGGEEPALHPGRIHRQTRLPLRRHGARDLRVHGGRLHLLPPPPRRPRGEQRRHPAAERARHVQGLRWPPPHPLATPNLHDARLNRRRPASRRSVTSTPVIADATAVQHAASIITAPV